MAIIRWGCSHTQRYAWVGGVDITSSSILQKPGHGAGNNQIGRDVRKHQSAARIKIRGADNIRCRIKWAAYRRVFKVKIN